MADPISAIAEAVSAFAAEGVGNALVAIGVSVETAATIATVVYNVGFYAVSIGTYAGLSALTRPEIPKAAAGQLTVKQTMANRVRVLNRARLPGAVMLDEAKKNYYKIHALCQGPALRIDARYFHDDKVTVDGAFRVIPPSKGIYRAHGVWFKHRLGLPAETSYADGTLYNGERLEDIGADWGADHRGDGVVSLLCVFTPVERADFRNAYPKGLPIPGAVPVMAAYDWRDPAQDINDPTTWAESWNPIVWLAVVECGPIDLEIADGLAAYISRFSARVLPQLAVWTQAADDCEEQIPLAGGGTEDRYRIANAWYYDGNHLADVRARVLSCCDGFTAEVGDGSLHVQVGKYREPTFTLPTEHVIGYDIRRGRRSDIVVNQYDVSYCSEAHDWSMVPGQPWRDEADIERRGAVKPQPFPAEWCPSHGQGRRLAKRAMDRVMADGRGTIRTDLYGLNFLYGAPPEGLQANRRHFRAQIENEIGLLEDVVFELTTSPRIDLANLSIEFDVVRIDPVTIDAWDAATEEGTPPDTGTEAGGGLDVPETVNTGDTAQLFFSRDSAFDLVSIA